MTVQEPTTVRRNLAQDWQRPVYHFLPPSNWMNDPNGLIQWKGTYHLFYQHNPHGAVWGDMHWGHAASENLIHWRDLPIALAPTPGSADESGIFSGCCVDNGAPTILYTGTRGAHCEIQTQCLATSADDLLTWNKYPGNPVLTIPTDITIQNSDFRDPYAWREGDTWYLVVGSRIQDVGGAVFLYKSPNLIDWEYLHPLLVNSTEPKTGIWECPNFFPLGDRWVLIISSHTGSTTGDVLYFVGTFTDHQFAVESRGVLDYGRLYAPLTFADSGGRRLLMGWVRESRSNEELSRAGWAGAQSIPRVLALDAQRRLIMTPVPEVQAIRGQRLSVAAQELAYEAVLEVAGLALDIEAAFAPGSDGICGLSLACSEDGQQRTDIVYDAVRCSLVVRTSGTENIGVQEVPHRLANDEQLELRVLLDGSVLEVIANGRTSVTSRIYAPCAEDNRTRLYGSEARLERLDIWEMPSIW